jgi:hydroxyacylglutathione hydrolase
MLGKMQVKKWIPLIRITAEQFKSELKVGESTVIDVRRDSEYSAEHVEEAFSRPLSDINIWFSSIDDS